jgi:UDP:flavonoid glycosyltransferase YjiC (YdhE family)
MGKFLFTMWPANDLGLPSRLLPIARLLADRGHEVAMYNPAPAPSNLIASAGLQNLPALMPPVAPPMPDLNEAHSAWDAEHLLAPFYKDQQFVKAMTDLYVRMIQDYAPDVVVDSFELFACLAARVAKVPLVSVLQGSFHPASRGFFWWKSERPQNLPSASETVNNVALLYGLAPKPRSVDWLAGDCCLIVGTPETEQLPANAKVDYVGPIVWQNSTMVLPEWVTALDHGQPLVWIYSGNPRYAGAPTPIDSIVVIRTAIAALAEAPVHVVLTTGYQELPAEFGNLPANFHHAAYLPGMAMAQRSNLMVHHGGHGSVMTGLLAGTPAVIIPTISEREGNARCVAALGAGEVVLPSTGIDGEKQVDVAEFRAKVERVLHEPAFRTSAQRVAESMRKYGGAREAADRIERLANDSERGMKAEA